MAAIPNALFAKELAASGVTDSRCCIIGTKKQRWCPREDSNLRRPA